MESVTEGITRGVSRGISEDRSTGLGCTLSESIIAGTWPSIHYSYSRMRVDEVRRLAY